MDEKAVEHRVEVISGAPAKLAFEVPAVGAKASLYVSAVVVLSVLAVTGVVVVFLIRPDADNSTINTTIVAIVVPIITALLGAAVQQVHLAVNSRLTQLIELTAAANLAKGKLEGPGVEVEVIKEVIKGKAAIVKGAK